MQLIPLERLIGQVGGVEAGKGFAFKSQGWKDFGAGKEEVLKIGFISKAHVQG